MNCEQSNCNNPANFRYVWAGESGLICRACLPQLAAIAKAMGMRLPVQPLSTGGLQDEVVQWHCAVFSGRRPLATAKKLLEEASECHIAAKGEPTNWDAVISEAVDCAIVCYALAGMAGRDLDAGIRTKLEILIARGEQQKERDAERGVEH